MAWMRQVLEAVMVTSGSFGLLRGIVYLTALFGSDRLSKRAMRILRRPPLGQ